MAASASFGSQRELDEYKCEHEPAATGSSLPIGDIRPPKVEPLLSIRGLTDKDIKREQQKLKEKGPSPKPKMKETKSKQTNELVLSKCCCIN